MYHLFQLSKTKATISSLTQQFEHKYQLLIAKNEINQNLQEMHTKENSIQELTNKLRQSNEMSPNSNSATNKGQESTGDNKKSCTVPTTGSNDSKTKVILSKGRDSSKSVEELPLPKGVDNRTSTASDVRRIQCGRTNKESRNGTRKPNTISENVTENSDLNIPGTY